MLLLLAPSQEHQASNLLELQDTQLEMMHLEGVQILAEAEEQKRGRGTAANDAPGGSTSAARGKGAKRGRATGGFSVYFNASWNY